MSAQSHPVLRRPKGADCLLYAIAGFGCEQCREEGVTPERGRWPWYELTRQHIWNQMIFNKHWSAVLMPLFSEHFAAEVPNPPHCDSVKNKLLTCHKHNNAFDTKSKHQLEQLYASGKTDPNDLADVDRAVHKDMLRRIDDCRRWRRAQASQLRLCGLESVDDDELGRVTELRKHIWDLLLAGSSQQALETLFAGSSAVRSEFERLRLSHRPETFLRTLRLGVELLSGMGLLPRAESNDDARSLLGKDWRRLVWLRHILRAERLIVVDNSLGRDLFILAKGDLGHAKENVKRALDEIDSLLRLSFGVENLIDLLWMGVTFEARRATGTASWSDVREFEKEWRRDDKEDRSHLDQLSLSFAYSVEFFRVRLEGLFVNVGGITVSLAHPDGVKQLADYGRMRRAQKRFMRRAYGHIGLAYARGCVRPGHRRSLQRLIDWVVAAAKINADVDRAFDSVFWHSDGVWPRIEGIFVTHGQD